MEPKIAPFQFGPCLGFKGLTKGCGKYQWPCSIGCRHSTNRDRITKRKGTSIPRRRYINPSDQGALRQELQILAQRACLREKGHHGNDLTKAEEVHLSLLVRKGPVAVQLGQNAHRHMRARRMTHDQNFIIALA